MQPSNQQRKNQATLVKFFFIFVIIVFLNGCDKDYFGQDSVLINNKYLLVEVADSPEEREKGLMFRENLCENCGMLFVFEEVGKHSFWMKNTLIPLDMIFIDEEGVIVDILVADPCLEMPCKYYTPSEDVKYVLEVNKETSEINKFMIGDQATFYFI